jgi:prepilin-type N-terminal cleavage/methylation domain-containing protein
MTTRAPLLKSVKRQNGFTLIEAMIGLALSVIVTASMVGLMSNSLGSASRIIQMSQLTDELRNTMSMMSRDVRRANYSTNSVYCYANSECGDPTTGPAVQAADIDVSVPACLVFGLDRDWDGNANNDGGGAFRRETGINERGENVGTIEMWTGTSVPSCDDSSDWVAITDPDLVDITDFTATMPGTFDGSVEEDGGTTVTVRTRVVRLQITGELVLDRTISRRTEDRIKVRNNLVL